jgi:L-ascorbate metabolism protein UlaG (beta-lactamase superfamily)
VLPIGDLFTMGIHDSIEAIKLIGPKVVLPTHYGTWPPIEQDAAAWANHVIAETDSKPVVLGVGESYEVEQGTPRFG